MKGYVVALLEIILFFAGASVARKHISGLHMFDALTYYWFSFTVLTGFWEFTYISEYDKISQIAKNLIRNGNSVWTMDFSWKTVRPDLLARIFYAEYGASADREYQSEKRGDYWSRLIESSHALCCAAYCLAALVLVALSGGNRDKAYLISMYGMGMQFMNSLLYMGQYFLQCRDKDSVNYINSEFPLGPWLIDRWFMWVNLFWLVFPAIIAWAFFLNINAMWLFAPGLLVGAIFLMVLCNLSNSAVKVPFE